jgi:hypothetical protein
MMLETDGTVIVHQDDSEAWYKLTPDSNGSYVNGTWSQIANSPSGYGPLYYASGLLKNGDMIIEGGEYNDGSGEVWTNQGAIYHPLSNTWNTIAAPSGWPNIGDAQSVVLSNGTFMLAHPFADGGTDTSGTADALFNPSTSSWTVQPGTGKADRNDEEGWTLLPNSKVLTTNIEQAINDPSSPGAQVYTPSTGTWSSAGTLPVSLEDPSTEEMGPQVYRPNGQVFDIGANGLTATYQATGSSAGTWAQGPSFPSTFDSADGPASILPNGQVLVAASPGDFNTPTHYYLYNGSSLTQVADPPNAPNESSYVVRMLVLPTGQILFDDSIGGQVLVYNKPGTAPTAWRPTISSISSTSLARGATASLSGTQLAGRSDGAAYGDDNQDNTNYPLVRVTNTATGAVTYGRTYGWSTYSIAPNRAGSTHFVLPGRTPLGPSTLEVVANGIASAPMNVTITR